VAGDQADALGEVAGVARRLGAAGAVDEGGLADLDVVAGLEGGFADALVVDEGAVSAADVGEGVVAAVGLAELGVAARDLGVVQTDGVAGLAAHAEAQAAQLELFPLVGAFDHEQARHDSPCLVCGTAQRHLLVYRTPTVPAGQEQGFTAPRRGELNAC
jgi:hypothetical protein